MRGNRWALATAGATASLMQIWIDGVQLGGSNGGCRTTVACQAGHGLTLPLAARGGGGGGAALSVGVHEVVVRVNATASGGMSRRLFFLQQQGEAKE
jgi:hypothetical protein